MKKTSTMNQSTMVVRFAYEISKNGQVIDQPTIDFAVGQKDIQKLAKLMEDNGGYPVEMGALQSLSKKIYDKLYDEVFTKILPDEENFDDIDIYLDEEIPAELVEKADELVKHKDVEQPFYLLVDGEEKRFSIWMQISNTAFRKMKEIAMHPTEGKPDFESLKEREPEVYAELIDMIFECAYKCSIREYDAEKECVLKEFPYQVYASI